MELVDFGLICALREEAEALLKHFPDYSHQQLGPYDCYCARIERITKPIAENSAPQNLRVAIVVLKRAGNLASLHASTLLINTLAPRHLILFGICGGIIEAASDFRLGDIVVSGRVIYYEPAKTYPLQSENRPIYFPHPGKRVGNPLLKAARAIRDGDWTTNSQIRTL